MTFTFTSPEGARQQKMERLQPLIDKINAAIKQKEGAPFRMPCSEADDGDVTALIPLLNASGWNARRVSTNDADKFAGDSWAFELTKQQPPDDSTPRVFTTPAEARKGQDTRLKALFDRIQTLIAQGEGGAFSIKASETRMEDIEALKPDLHTAGWNVRRVDGHFDDIWVFEPLL